jgi:hypothetical protein
MMLGFVAIAGLDVAACPTTPEEAVVDATIVVNPTDPPEENADVT